MNNELTAALATIEKCREITGCPDGVDLQDHLRQLASENVSMRKILGEVVYSSEEVEHDGYLTFVVSPDSVHDAADLLEGETTATDRIVSGIKADGVEMFALMFAEEAIKDNNITTGWKARASRAASEYAELLREGAK
ncbi:hypothetical protein [Klebsiella spallanzanii]|uniref:hypothetical protein n=1 Tax=Klebsiella spallanzanii TaxID=2587528 RepID=UPI001F1D1F5B|nr:hypothetical protein [Klebsiella spallanzanii]